MSYIIIATALGWAFGQSLGRIISKQYHRSDIILLLLSILAIVANISQA